MKKIILLISIGLFYISAQAQNDSNKYENFELIIRTSNDQVVLTSKKGSAWKKLTFSTNNLPQAIDEYGMTVLENKVNKREKSEKTLADYTFILNIEKDEIILKGLEGTVWKELTFPCADNDCDSKINEMGMR
ncbi:hypothetical protein [Christiangramia salexigens]|uniref:Uncharacterized protein n=1 Tax=Christiangramia salexigens TaxID=1913577 RepID=A0A1L3J3Z9_9FLAO|nr:hypothetical protein [Christiangramia salexigens]APG59832.1 hypothetical protein LPB144_05115 [Christiangramia salexigens]